jgi:hypothetical protein
MSPPPTPDLPRASRALLMPGPLAPSSHLGVTLQRHLLAAALRYALYHLGLPLPDKPPVRIERLRLFLDGTALAQLLERVPGGASIAAALVDPGGAGPPPRRTRVGVALALHRLRLWRFRPPRPAPEVSPRSAPELWALFRRTLTALAPPVGNALLAEIAAATARRAQRWKGSSVPACHSSAAARCLAGKPVALRCFGSPDLRQPSWAEEARRADEARAAIAAAYAGTASLAPAAGAIDRYRGRYRLALRAALDRLRPIYLELADGAARRGVIERPDDAFFMPLDLADCLARERRPAWLDAAVASNRAELVRSFDGPEPPNHLAPGQEHPPADPAQWELAPLLPMP